MKDVGAGAGAGAESTGASTRVIFNASPFLIPAASRVSLSLRYALGGYPPATANAKSIQCQVPEQEMSRLPWIRWYGMLPTIGAIALRKSCTVCSGDKESKTLAPFG